MREELLHFAWMFRTYSHTLLKTDTMDDIEIIDPGQLNHNSGPDFFNAKIKINGTLWVGNVEIHLSSSDWYKHQHHTSKEYNNVVLHVVHVRNQETINELGNLIPTLELKLPASLINKYENLQIQATAIPCGVKLHKISEIYLNNWITNLAYEKFERKYNLITSHLSKNNNNWSETFYVYLSRNMGFSVNNEPFETLAELLPLKILNKHLNNKSQVEALIFGTAGFLNEANEDDAYYNNLTKEYHFLAKKYELKHLEKHQWKFMRLRPNNFPTIRLAQLASILCSEPKLFSKILEADSLKSLRLLFKATASHYWTNHFRFNTNIAKTPSPKHIGNNTIDLLILNTAIPFLFTYGKENNMEHYCEKAFGLLESMKPERNSIINRWSEYKITSINAFQSQALIYLYNNYCKTKKCLQCQIGHQILSKVK